LTVLQLRSAVTWLLVLASSVGVGAAPEKRRVSWVRVEYGALVDGRKLTHSGEPIGVLLARLDGRPMPKGDEPREDALSYRLLDPLLEPYAFVLSDALDTLGPAPDPPMVEVGALWETGEAQPAWVELVRARRLLLESDGEGHLRACLPEASLEAATAEGFPDSTDPVAIAELAWKEAWPVLRHALAGERRRLARLRGGQPPVLEVEVHAYRHLVARSAFDLGVTPWRTRVSDTGPGGGRAPLDLVGLKSLLDRELWIEGARLDPSGRVRWFASEADTKPSILGHAPTLADLAVAYRAVARGGYGEPYMSLDRAAAPQVANVNYGGRLRDTALGMVSLLSDVRFKTFSVGIDLLGTGDIRDAIRRSLPGFATHLERFASDRAAGTILNQQTRFWFYPDDVDLTLSAEGDVLAFRKVRMTAASERVRDAGAASSEPPWTTGTVGYLNANYDGLARLFPELAELDESVRLLALFTWFEAARGVGLAVPDLDVLLGLELPALPTPRRFPELLSYDVLPPPGTAGLVDVLDRTDVGAALDRLDPTGSGRLPAGRRFARDLALLNPQVPDQAALANEMAALAADASVYEEDLMSYRAERLLMHARVLATVSAERRAAVEARRKREPATRVFSVGIGGVDLGMNTVLARAKFRSGHLGMGAGERTATATVPADAGAKPNPKTTLVEPAPPAVDPPGLPTTEWPDHGLGPVDLRVSTVLPDRKGTILARRRSGSLVRKGTFNPDGGVPVLWDEVRLCMEGPEARTRRRIADPAGAAPVFERVEDERFVSYRFDRTGNTLRASVSSARLPSLAFGESPQPTGPSGTMPAALILMNVLPPGEVSSPEARYESPTVGVRLRVADGRERVASLPRSLLQRLVRGRAIDLTPDRPLGGFTPAAEVLGGASALMVVQSVDETRAPWSGPIIPRPGEEDAARLAASLSSWWSAEPSSSSAKAVVGTDALASPARWVRAPRLDGSLAVTAPESAVASQAAAVRAGLGEFPAGAGATLVVIVSAESPGVLGKRLRAAANDPAFAGKILAVASLGGPLRGDLPASLLLEGRLAALGVYEGGPVGLSKSIDEIARFARTAASDASKGRRAEELPGPFNWFY
jgi:hypothetical protein